MTWREQKRAARQLVHGTFGIEAQYYASRGATPVTVHVRLRSEFNQLMVGTRKMQGWAETQAVEPNLVFMRSEQEPQQGAVVWIAVGEAYRIDTTNPPDDITRTANVTRLTAKQYADEGLPT